MNTEEMVAAYIKVRDKKAEIRARQAEELKPYDELLTRLEAEMMKVLDQTGADSMKTKAGTAYRIIRTSVTIADKSAFMDHVTNNHEFELLDVRANKTAVEGYLADHQDLPPGVNVHREQVVGIRRA